jgi:glutathione S-transferase
MGVPSFDKHDQRIDLFKFADLDLSPRVAQGFHAMAIDEYRRDFTPTPWNAREGITQVWFVGAHADVGGGYKERGLADIPLAWMMRNLADAGVRFAAPAPAGNPLDVLHDSWNRKPYNLYRRVPRIIDRLARVHRSHEARRAGGGYDPSALKGWGGGYVD